MLPNEIFITYRYVIAKLLCIFKLEKRNFVDFSCLKIEIFQITFVKYFQITFVRAGNHLINEVFVLIQADTLIFLKNNGS